MGYFLIQRKKEKNIIEKYQGLIGREFFTTKALYIEIKEILHSETHNEIYENGLFISYKVENKNPFRCLSKYFYLGITIIILIGYSSYCTFQ